MPRPQAQTLAWSRTSTRTTSTSLAGQPLSPRHLTCQTGGGGGGGLSAGAASGQGPPPWAGIPCTTCGPG